MFTMIERKLRRLEVRLNRPMLPRQSLDEMIRDWGAASFLSSLAQKRPEILIAVTTFRRPGEVADLINALVHALGYTELSVHVCIFNDASDADYSGARDLLSRHFNGNSTWLDSRRNFGKRGFWQTHQMMFRAAEVADSEFLLSLQDDIELVPDFFQKLFQVWSATGQADERRRVLYLFSGDDDEPHGRWNLFDRVDLPEACARRTDWFDLQAFLIDRAGLALLRYWVVPISLRRWRKDPTVSSGVGDQFTRRIAGRATVYQCDPPLVFHGRATSQMNPEARSERPLDNRAKPKASN